MTGVIYKIENKVSGKVYIGQTRQQGKRRLQAHLRELRRNNHDNIYFQSAFNKYGEESFEYKVVERCEVSKLDEIEVRWIEHYKLLKGVYNLESGGGSGKELHESTRRKMSEITKSHGWVGGNHPGSVRVICIDTKEVFNSIIEASEKIGCNYDNVHQVCLGNNVSARGKCGKYYQFAYYEEGKNYKLKKLKGIKTPKRVVLVNTKEFFNSTREASLKTGVAQSKISLCCNGKRNFAGRFENGDWMKWVFEEDYDENKTYSFKRKRIQTQETRNKISEALKKRKHAI